MDSRSEQAAYAAEAKARWGGTRAYRAYESRAENRTETERQRLRDRLMEHFTAFGALVHLDPASDAPQKRVRELKAFLSENYYPCSNEVLMGLGQMYAADERFRATIDSAGGEGTAVFVRQAIEAYCKKA